MTVFIELGRYAENKIDGGVAAVSAGMFGVIALSDSSTAVRAFSDFSSNVDVGLIRWPGGTLSERGTVDMSGKITVSGVAGQPFVYDLKYPELIHPSLAGAPGLSEMLSQARQMNVPFSMLLPTGRYEGDPAAAYADTMAFLTRMFTQGSFTNGVPPEDVILEIGNENYDPAGYGAVAASMLRAVSDFRAQNPSVDFDVALQSMQSLADTNALASRIDQLSDRWGGTSVLAEVDIVRTHFLSQGLSATSIVEDDRTDPARFDRIDTLSSLIRAIEASRSEQPGRSFQDVDVYFSAWTVSSDDVAGAPNMGLPAVASLILLFAGMAELGVDYAAAWGVGTRNPMTTSLVLGSGASLVYSPVALALDWMSTHLPGTSLVSTAGNDGTRGTPYNTVVFQGPDRIVVLVSANDYAGTILNVDLSLSGVSRFGLATGVMISQQTGSLAGTQGDLIVRQNGGNLQFTFTQDYQTAMIVIPIPVSINDPSISQNLTARLGHQLIEAGDGHDTITGSIGDDTLYGGAHNDSITGGLGYDRLFGGEGTDVISGEAGNDVIEGGSEADTLNGGDGDDSIDGGDGSDQVFAGGGADTLAGGLGEDSLLGGDGNDSMSGNSGNDTLQGDAGADFLDGGAGNDSLFGGTDNDTTLGGDGK